MAIILEYILDRAFLYQSIATLGVLLIITLAKLYTGRRKRHQLLKLYGIPGPKPTLFQGSLSAYIDQRQQLNNEVLWHKKYGKVFGVFCGDEFQLFVTDIDMLKEIFLDLGHVFVERTFLTLKHPLTAGILFAPYHRWKVMRLAMAPAFSKFVIRKSSSTEFIEDAIRKTLQYIDDKIASSSGQDGAEINATSLMKAATLNLISEMAIKLPNLKVSENEPIMRRLRTFLDGFYDGVLLMIFRFPFLAPVAHFISDHFAKNSLLSEIGESVDQFVEFTIKKLRSRSGDGSPKREAVIEFLTRLHLEGKMTREEVISNALNILVAGYDTSSSILAYALWFLAKNKSHQKELRDDLMAHGVDSKHLEQFIFEVLRLYPSVTTACSRVSVKTIKVGDWTIPQGTRVIYHSWLMNRNPDYWTNPEVFDHTRFENGLPEHPCIFAPFGLGEKKCLGYQLAMLELKMFICDLLLRYKVDLISPEKLEIMACGTMLTQPVGDVKIKFRSVSVDD